MQPKMVGGVPLVENRESMGDGVTGDHSSFDVVEPTDVNFQEGKNALNTGSQAGR